MDEMLVITKLRRTALSAFAGLSLCFQSTLANAQELVEVQARNADVTQAQVRSRPPKNRAQVTYDSYILGPGDGLQIELLDLPELSGRFQSVLTALFIYRACVLSTLKDLQ